MAYPKGFKLHHKCSIEKCSTEGKIKLGLCEVHYFRKRRHGDPNITLRIKMDHPNRFRSKVNKDGPIQPHMKTPCWLWTDPLRKDGYGQIRVSGKYVLAHRYSFFLTEGRFAQPMTLHHCDVKACVRPDHLYEGTHQDNVDDRQRRNRQPTVIRSRDLRGRFTT